MQSFHGVGTCRWEERLYQIFSVSPQPPHSLGVEWFTLANVPLWPYICLYPIPVFFFFLLIVIAVTDLPNHSPNWFLLDNVFSSLLYWFCGEKIPWSWGNGSRMRGVITFVHSLGHSAPKDPRNKSSGFLFPVSLRTEGRKIWRHHFPWQWFSDLMHIRMWG